MALNWKYRLRITIDHTKIDSDLTHFPLLLKLGSSVGLGSTDVSSIFNEVGVNSQKIAITESDGETQLYAEVERWDPINKVAEIWVSRSDFVISSTVDTVLYFYYDNTQPDNTTYIGTTPDDAASMNVWDSHYKGVWHLKDDTVSTTKDSTSNNNDGTKFGSVEADGKIAEGQSFDGVNDYVSISDSPSLNITGAITVEAFVYSDVFDKAAWQEFVMKGDSSRQYQLRPQNGTGALQFIIYAASDGVGRGITSIDALSNGKWHHVVGTYDGVYLNLYIDGVLNNSLNIGSYTIQTSTAILAIGRLGGGAWSYFEGLIDEVRVSDIARPPAWVKAVHNTVEDTLLIWATQATAIRISSLYDYLDTATPDYTATVLSVTPTEVLEEEGEFRQIVHTMDDGTEAVVSLSTKRWFWVTLQWDYRPEADAGTIMEYYFDPTKAYGMARSFYWQHPRDGHTYVVKFADKLRRAHHAGVVDHLSVRGMRLRVIGRKLDA